MFQHRKCPSCGTDRAQEEVRSEKPAEGRSLDEVRRSWIGIEGGRVFFSYARCQGCGLLYAPTYFTLEQLEKLYASSGPNMYMVTSDAIAATQRGYWLAAKKTGLRQGGGYLEIGPDLGYIVRHAAAEGDFDQFWSVEPNRRAHEHLHEASAGKPHRIITDMDDLSPVPDGSIELAVMVHVLDHVLDPIAMLRQVRAKLRPDGLLVIVTHNEKSVLRRVMKSDFPPFCLQHPELYNPRSLRAVLERAGYSRVTVARSTNYFPVAFLARHAGALIGLNLAKLPLPNAAVGLKLGNIFTTARV